MHYVPVFIGTLLLVSVAGLAQTPDSVKVNLRETVVVGSQTQDAGIRSSQPVVVVGKAELREHFSGNFVQNLSSVPGVQSMDIGSGFSKPMIRGMAFNRIAVVADGIRQEGQQWGVDHGLEMDAFDIEQVHIIKGPASLLFGSDAMGGVIETVRLPAPQKDMVFGEVNGLAKSNNRTLATSGMAGLKRGKWYGKMRFSMQDFADYAIPADTVVYLTQRLPVEHRRLKNSAGFERNGSLFARYAAKDYSVTLSATDAFQKVGFFPGAHGVPDASRVHHDGDYRNIEPPYSMVNHLKVAAQLTHRSDRLLIEGTVGYQNNHREEWSLFHTHYAAQQKPEKDPDKELMFVLQTVSSNVKAIFSPSARWTHVAGADFQHQYNRIDGYAFLLPNYRRTAGGLFLHTTYQPRQSVTWSVGIRYDIGKIAVTPYSDPYLSLYLRGQGYTEEQMAVYQWRSYGIRRQFDDVSYAAGVVWYPLEQHVFKAHIGRSFRLPAANELAANGVHHGTFQHEQGDPSLTSEKGWQLDLFYRFTHRQVTVSVSPFASLYDNYIFLRPTGEWSLLPDAGQIYRYTGTKALFMGGEASVEILLGRYFSYYLSGEYVYTSNRMEQTAMYFSPPASMRHVLKCTFTPVVVAAEWQGVAAQNHVAKNEERTPGVNLLHGSLSSVIPFEKYSIEATFTVKNIFNKPYFNHLSFYRKLEIPEPGRSFLLSFKLSFIHLLKNK
ncbi:MAG: TonB-dependent receptor [Prevotellaceae bacterium]|jgi:iron complex outermembrane receptor protein|nr:TonB-dependent receptor [Prevotellaceae bacterium]